jgi:predicted Zn-dependent peptidase
MKYYYLLIKTAFSGLILSVAILAAFLPVYSQSASTQPKEEKLLNGLKLLMFDAPGTDKVTLKVRIHAGSAFDPQGKEGLMKLLAANVFPHPEAKEYFAEQLGGSLDVLSNYDFIQIDASSKPDKLVNMIEVVATAIVSMQNDKETTVRLKEAQLKRISELCGDPSYVADQAAAARLLGTFPYGRPSDGTAVSVGKIDFADLLGAKQRFFTGDNATVAISGSFDQTIAYRAVRRYFGAWLKADKLVPSTFRQPDDPPTGVQMLESPVADKFEVRFITRGTSVSSNDFAAYRVAAKVVENRLKGLIPQGTDGSVSVVSQDHVLPGIFIVRFSGTKDPKNTKIEANDIVTKSLAAPVTDPEFRSAQQSVIADLNKEDLVDRWLDTDTFRTEPPAKFYARASGTSLVDVQNVLSRIQSQRIASVVVTTGKASN